MYRDFVTPKHDACATLPAAGRVRIVDAGSIDLGADFCCTSRKPCNPLPPFGLMKLEVGQSGISIWGNFRLAETRLTADAGR